MSQIRELSIAEFPPGLKEIPEPPKHLWLEGNLPNPKENVYLTIVGSRRFSAYGRDVCQKIIAGLAGYPVVIVSGLAVGIDTLAHRAALETNLFTLAIPGSGLNRQVLHPPGNRFLADKIVESGGGLLSEFPPDYPASLHTFPRRNRLMAGIAKAVLIVEAGERSGTLITARLAADYNRDLFVIPGSIFSPNSLGTNQLIRQGAAPITSSGELLRELGFEPEEEKKTNLAALSAAEKQIYDLLAVEPHSRDDLIEKLDWPASATNSTLTIMEIKGLIKEELGQIKLT